MRARRLGLALAVLLLIAWALVARRPTRATVPDAEERAAAPVSESQELALADAPSSASVPASRSEAPPSAAPASDGRVVVRSELGLPLAHVELAGADQGWREVVLSAGALHVPDAERPLRIRAPGHRAAELVPGARELVLAPHTSLVLTSFPFERVKRADPFGAWESQRDAGERFVSAGACNATTWAIAFDAPQLRTVVPDLDMVFQLDDGTEARIAHELEPGRHDVYAWPRPPLDVRTEMLAVTVERSGADRGTLVAEIHAYTDRQPGSRALFNEKLPWGRFVLMDYLELVAGRFEDERFELGPLVVGKRYALTVRDEASGDHDRAFLVHDGSPVHARLAGGLRLRGTLGCAPTLRPARLERIVWSFGERANAPYWREEPQRIPIAEDGSFQLFLPDPVPFAERAPFPRPTALHLELRASGFETRLVHLDTAGQNEIDLGTVRMAPLPTQMLLAAGHGLVAEDLSCANVLVADPVRATTVYFSLAGAQAREDGALALALLRSDESAGFEVYGRIDESALPWPEPDALVLELNGEGIPFRRGPGGRFQRELTRTYHMVVEAALAEDAGELAVRWEWQGIHQWIRNWSARAFEQPQEWTFSAPERGVQLRWTLGKEPPDAHPGLPLSHPEIVLRLP